MNYTNDTSAIMDSVLFGISGDVMMLSDKFRIASFLETTTHKFQKNKSANKII